MRLALLLPLPLFTPEPSSTKLLDPFSDSRFKWSGWLVAVPFALLTDVEFGAALC